MSSWDIGDKEGSICCMLRKSNDVNMSYEIFTTKKGRLATIL